MCRSHRQATRARDEADTLRDSILYHASRPGGTEVRETLDTLAPRYGHDTVLQAIRTLISDSTITLTGTKISK